MKELKYIFITKVKLMIENMLTSGTLEKYMHSFSYSKTNIET